MNQGFMFGDITACRYDFPPGYLPRYLPRYLGYLGTLSIPILYTCI